MRLFILLFFLFSGSAWCSGFSMSGMGFGEVSYGFGYHDRVGNLKRKDVALLEKIRGLIAKDLGAELKTVKVYGYVKMGSGVYAVYGYVPDSSSLKSRASVGLGELFFIDIDNEKIRKINKKSKGFNSLLLSIGGRYSTGGVAVYGCLQGYPVAKADIDGDEIGDLIFTGGKGELYLPNDEVRASTRIDFYMSSSGYLSFPMHAESFSLYFDNIESGYKVSRSKHSDFVDGGLPEVGRGFRKFSKLFWGDWGEDGERAIVLWEKTYVSRKVGDLKSGMKFNKENFRVFFVGDGYIVKEGAMEEAPKILKNNKLEWRDGYPNKSLCDLSSDVDPILDYGRKELFIKN